MTDLHTGAFLSDDTDEKFTWRYDDFFESVLWWLTVAKRKEFAEGMLHGALLATPNSLKAEVLAFHANLWFNQRYLIRNEILSSSCRHPTS